MLEDRKVNFIRIPMKFYHGRRNIYLFSKSFLRKGENKLQQLAGLDIGVLINCKDEEKIFENTVISIKQLCTKSIKQCKGILAYQAQGVCRIIEDFGLKQNQSIGLFCQDDFYYSHMFLACYFIYSRYQFDKIDKINNLYITIENREQKLIQQNNENIKVNNRMAYINGDQCYQFKLVAEQIGEIEKFVQTNDKTQEIQDSTKQTLSEQFAVSFEKLGITIQYLNQHSRSTIFGQHQIIGTEPRLIQQDSDDQFQKYFANFKSIQASVFRPSIQY